MIYKSIDMLISYALNKKLIKNEDVTYCINRILALLNLDEYKCGDEKCKYDISIEEILSHFGDYAAKNNICGDNAVEKEIFETEIMDVFIKHPSEIIENFYKLYKESSKKATDYFYKLSKDSNYIKVDRIKKDIKWKTKTEYGYLDITVNLSKPEKDPKAIAQALKAKNSNYPKCLLCKENEGYKGRINHPARANHRVIPFELLKRTWYMQYSPYVYYNEHCIIFSKEHNPMVINKGVFETLLGLVKKMPHYTFGSNADLPIVGGSILTHEHFQGGRYEFPMERAVQKYKFKLKDYKKVDASILAWPMSVIRLKSKNIDELVNASDMILNKWRCYTDEDAFIYACTDGVKHNTITPIARKRNGFYEMDLVLRNNITTKDRPDGLYHPSPKLHHIKKENIGLIEVMGLAILPGRLKNEFEHLKECILNNDDISKYDDISKHYDWVNEFIKKYKVINKDNIDKIIQKETGLVFKEVLEDAGVYKSDDIGLSDFIKFIDNLNN